MNSLARSIVGAAVTAAAVYYLDPANGHQRRVLLQDRCKRAAQQVEWSTRNLRRNGSGKARHSASGNGNMTAPKSDKALTKAVCGAVRHSVSHPESISVAVDRGHVILRGDLLPHEHQRVLDEVRRQPGILLITDHLAERGTNGEYAVDGSRNFQSAAGRSAWSTGGRVLAGCAGGALLYWGVRERKALSKFGVAIAEEVQHAFERGFAKAVDAAKEGVEAAREELDDAADTAVKGVEDGVQWAGSAGSDGIDQYTQMRNRQSDAAGAAH